MTDKLNKYLIIGPSWVGDMVMAQSLFIDIKLRESSAIIDVLAPAWTAALIDRMPEIRKLVPANFEHGKLSLKERFLLGKELRSEGYSHSIVLPNSIKSALVPAIARIPIRTGFIGEQRWGLLNDIRSLDKSSLSMTVQRFVALGLSNGTEPRLINSIPIPRLEVDKVNLDSVMNKFNLSLDKQTLVLCPGAEFGASKQWPMAYFAEVAQHYSDKGWQVWLMGSDKDSSVCEQINQATNFVCETLAGKTNLPEAVDLISQASLVLSNDSGLMHIAAALQKPVVAVYGSTDPSHTPPLSNNSAIVRLDLECSPCFKRECPLIHHNCMKQLQPELVFQQAQSLIQ